VKKERITEILSKDVPPEEKVRELVENALENGSDDNITVCICAGDGRPAEKENEPFLLD
jgi:serine/threonine protein phosphatase PrpC